MKYAIRILAALAFSIFLALPALAQNTTGLVVSSCGTVSHAFIAGNPGPFTVDTTGKMCVAAATPSGAAGGDLAGTYPNPTVVGLGGVPYTFPVAHGAAGSVLTDVAGNGTLSWAAGGGGPSSANPSATIGLSAVNGTAATFMTSDSAPPLSQAIVPTWTGAHTFSSKPVTLSGNQSVSAWTTTGTGLIQSAASYTDTSSSGTVAAAYTNVFGASTVLASSATAYTNYYGTYFKAPVASTNVTMTNKWAVGVDSLSSAGLIGSTSAGSAAAPSVFVGNATTGLYSVSTTGFGFTINGVVKLDYGITSASTWTFGGTIDAGGATINNTGSIHMGSARTLDWTSRNSITAPADGNYLFQVNAQTNGVKLGVSAIDGLLTVGTSAGGSNNALGAINLTNLTGTGTIIIGTADAGTSTGGALQVTGGASVAKRLWIPAISVSSGLQTAVLCQSSGGEMIADSVACLASSARFKNIIGPMQGGTLAKLVKLPIERWAYKSEGIFKKGDWTRERVGPIAEDVAAMEARLAGYDADGKVRSYSTEQLLAFTIKAVQELKADNDNLRGKVEKITGIRSR